MAPSKIQKRRTKVPVVLVPSLSLARQAQYQVVQAATESDPAETETKPAEAKTSIEVQVPLPSEAQRLEYKAVPEPDENAEYEAIRADFMMRFGNLPWEMKQAILCAFATKPTGAARFVDAFLLSKDEEFVKFRPGILKAIEQTEVVLSGAEHSEQYNALHRVVPKRAKYLKIIYTGERIHISQKDRNKRSRLIRQLRALNSIRPLPQVLRPIPPPLPSSLISEHPPFVHERFPLIGQNPNHGWVQHLNSFVACQELTLDLRAFIDFRNTDPEGLNANVDPMGQGRRYFDYYAHVTTTLSHAAASYWGPAGRRPGLFVPPNPIQVGGVAVPGFFQQPHRPPAIVPPIRRIRKLTLILPQSEIARATLAAWPYSWIDEFTRLHHTHDIAAQTRLLQSLPTFEVLRAAFTTRTDFHVLGLPERLGPGVPMLSEFEIDAEKGEVVFMEVGYQG